MGPFDFGALGFWVFIAAVVVGGMWKETRQKAERHETLRRIVEKTGTIDEAKLKELFDEKTSDEWRAGSGYRALRVSGTILMFIGAGIATFFLIPTLIGKPIEWWYGGLSVAAGVAMVGAGMFFSSRFAEPPPGIRSEPPAR